MKEQNTNGVNNNVKKEGKKKKELAKKLSPKITPGPDSFTEVFFETSQRRGDSHTF